MPAPNLVDPAERDTRVGALLWLVGTLIFVLVMIVAELGYGCANVGGCYNPLTNPISDLGSAGFAGNPPYSTGTIPWPVSPLWPVFNYGIMLFGAFIVVGAFLLPRAFPQSRLATLALAIFALAGFGGAGVGVVAEDTILAIHASFALIAFAGAGVALLVVAYPLARDPRWGRGWTLYTLASGLFSVAATVVFQFPSWGLLPGWAISGAGFGYGAMERLIIVAPLLWLIVASIHVLRWPRPSGASPPATSEAPGPAA